jgi:hypothetical protein
LGFIYGNNFSFYVPECGVSLDLTAEASLTLSCLLSGVFLGVTQTEITIFGLSRGKVGLSSKTRTGLLQRNHNGALRKYLKPVLHRGPSAIIKRVGPSTIGPKET